jgi:signal transduction histidine kinase
MSSEPCMASATHSACPRERPVLVNVRPLDRLRSIKVKLGVVIIVSVVVSVAVVIYGWRTGIRPRFLLVLTGAVVLVVIQFLAHGMTKPLREMATATHRVSSGDFSVRVTATSRDEVGELATAFNSMAERIAELDSERRAFVANVSHELRSPLAAVRARLENIVDGIEPAEADALTAMLRSVERLGRLVDQLLDLSRLERGDELDSQVFAVRDVLDAVAEESRIAGAERDIEVVVLGEPLVDGNPERIHQVIANLVDNAITHSPAGCQVRIDARDSETGTVVSVADEGPGVPPDVAARMFERFYRAPHRNGSTRGAGLGLAIARSIVEGHGGSISVDAASADGCRMVVQFPPVAQRASH